MDYKVHISPFTKIGIAEAIEYYSEINDKLPQKLMEELYSNYESLKFNPHYQKRYKEVRGLPLKNFPYLFLFTVDEDRKKVEVLSFFHTSQNPKKYPK